MQIDRRSVLGAGALITGLAASASAKTRRSSGGKAEKNALATLADYVEQHRTDWGMPGMTVAVVSRDGFSGFVDAGLADVDRNIAVSPDHLFQIGSITKMMTALTAWSLIDEGKLSPDARLADLMPGLSVRDGDTITLQHLLDHTSGLPRGTPVIVDGGLWSGYEPGSQWSYCNLGYKLAGMIAGHADGKLFPESVEARVLRPLGMNASIGSMRAEDLGRYARGYQPALLDRPFTRPPAMRDAPWVDYDGASGCVASTASDMALFLRFLIGLANGEGGPVFTNETAQRFLANPADAPGWSEGTKYGNGIAHIEKDGRRYLHHTGGMVSFSSSLHVDVEAGVAAFASANIHYATNYRPRDVTAYACELLRTAQAGEDAPAAPPTKPRVEKPAHFAGVFTAASGDAFEVIAGENSIRMRRNDIEHDMQPVGDKSLAVADEDFAITGIDFEIEDDKPVRAWAGGVEYIADPSRGYLPKSDELASLEGRYDRDDRWALPVRVYARGEKLCLKSANYTSTLTRLDNGDWRPGDKEWWPDYIRFDGFLNGKAERLLSSGVPFLRRFS